MAITASNIARTRLSNRWLTVTKITGDASGYAAGGYAVTANDLQLGTIDEVLSVEPDDTGYEGQWDRDNAKLKVSQQDIASTSLTFATAAGTIVDDNSAASNGTALYVTPIAGASNLGYFQSTTAGNADAVYAVGNGGPTVTILDNDSPTGATVHFDDDGATADQRLVADLSSVNGGQDIYVPTSSGQMIRVVHDASATSTGTDVYFDDDATNNYERLLSVNAGNADSTFDTDDEFGLGIGSITVDPAAGTARSEVANGTNLASESWIVTAIGT